MNIESLLTSVADSAKSAIAKAKAEPGGDKKKPPFLNEEEMGKQKGKVKSIAERLLSIGNKMEESGKPPDGPTLQKLRGIANELGAAVDRYPSAKTVKSVDMSSEKFEAFAKDEIAKAIEENDGDRLELLKGNIESVSEQVSFCPRADVVKISIFADPGQQTDTTTQTQSAQTDSTPDVAESMGALVKQLSSLVDSFKAKPKPDKEEDMNMADKKKPGCKADGEGDGEGDDADKKKPGEEEKKRTEKSAGSDDVVWPRDLNRAGLKKSDDDADRDFGRDF